MLFILIRLRFDYNIPYKAQDLDQRHSGPSRRAKDSDDYNTILFPANIKSKYAAKTIL